MKKINFFPLLLLLLFVGCGGSDDGSYGDTNISVPSGDPPFPALGMDDPWIIDKAGVLSKETIRKANDITIQLQNDGVAELVVLVMNGVKNQPETYATHFGRATKLGRKGMASTGGQNGLVWLIRPDAELRMTVSIGRGLPQFTSQDAGYVMDKARDYLNFNNFDQGVLVLVQETDKKLREIYGKKP